jgi:hypothetical protein
MFKIPFLKPAEHFSLSEHFVVFDFLYLLRILKVLVTM